MAAPAIALSALRKSYRPRWGGAPVAALDGIDLEVAPGELFGLLGPNGAGKTTAVKILLGLTRAGGGAATLGGRPVSDPEARRAAGYLPEGHRFPGYLTARQTLAVFGRLSGVDDATLRARGPRLLETVGLAKWAEVKVRKFSKGMTQRLGLAAALIHDPAVLLLDEPTDGVDPVGRREIRDLLKSLAASGKTVLVNSHLLGEIELTCDRVAMLNRGKIARLGTVAALTARGLEYRLAADGIDAAAEAALAAAGVALAAGNGHRILSAPSLEALNGAIDALRARGALIRELAPLKNSLEDVFVGLVRPPADGAKPELPS